MPSDLNPILALISYLSNQQQDKSTQEIGEALEMNRNLVSKYLTILHMQGRVEVRTYGTLKMYRLSERIPFQSISDVVEGICIGLDRLLFIRDVGNDPYPFFSEDKSSIIGKMCTDIDHPCFEDETFLQHIRSLLDGKISENFRTEYWKEQSCHSVKLYQTVFNDGSPGVAISFTDCTKEKKLHGEIEQLEQRYFILTRSNQGMILHLSPDKRILYANDSYAGIYELNPDDIIGSLYEPVLPSEDGIKFRKAFTSLNQNNPSKSLEHRVVMKDGSIRWQQWTITAFFFQNKISEYYLSGIDITRVKLLETQNHQYESGLEKILKEKTEEIREVTRNLYKEIEDRKRLEREISQKEELFRNLTESTSDIIWETNSKGIFTYINPVFCTTMGFPNDEIIGKSLFEFLPPDAGEEFQSIFLKCLEKNEAFNQVDLPFIKHDGGIVTIELSGVVSIDYQGKVTGIRGVGRDITERKNSEYEKKKLLTIIERSPDLIGICDSQGVIQYLNPSGMRMLEIPENNDLQSLYMDKFYHPRSKLKIKNGIKIALKEGYWRGETVFITWNKKELPVSQVIVNNQSDPKEPLLLFTIAQDISELIYHDRELARLNIYTRSLLDASLDPLVTIGHDGTIQDVNTATEYAIGLSRDELIGTDFNQYFLDPKQAEKGYQKSFSDGFIRDYPLDIQHQDGHITPVLYNASVYRDESGKIQGVFAAARDMSNLYQVERELRESLEYYLNILNDFPNPIWRAGIDKKCDYFNNSWLKFTGRTLEQEIGEGWMEGVHPDDLMACLSEYSHSFDERIPFNIQYRLSHCDGTYHWIIDYGEPLYSKQGEYTGYIGSCYDIDQIKKAEEIIRVSEKKYRELHENMMDGYVSVDMKGKILDFNETYRHMLGYEADELLTLTLRDITPEEWHQSDLEYMQNQILARGYSDVYEKEYRRKDGTVFPVEMRKILSKDDQGYPVSMWAIVRDISSRKEVEKTLIENKNNLLSNQIQLIAQNEELIRNNEEISRLEAKYRLISEYSTDVIWLLDLALMKFTYISPSVQKLSGYSPDEILANPLEHAFTPESAAMIRKDVPERVSAYVSGDETALVAIQEVDQVRRDGSIVHTEVVTTLLPDPDGMVRRILGVSRDISTRKIAEQKIAESQEFYRILFESSLYGVIFLDQNGTILSSNPASERILGLSSDEMRGRQSGDPRWRAIHEDGSPFPEDTHPSIVALRTGKIIQNIPMGVYNRVLDQYVWIKITAIPLFHQEEEEPYLVNTIFEDITLQLNLNKTVQNWQDQAVLLTNILEHSSQPIGIAYPDGTIWYVNTALADLFQCSPEEISSLTQSAYVISPERENRDVSERPNHDPDKKMVRYERELIRKDGKPVPVEVYSYLITDETGEPVYYYLLINEQKLNPY